MRHSTLSSSSYTGKNPARSLPNRFRTTVTAISIASVLAACGGANPALDAQVGSAISNALTSAVGTIATAVDTANTASKPAGITSTTTVATGTTSTSAGTPTATPEVTTKPASTPTSAPTLSPAPTPTPSPTPTPTPAPVVVSSTVNSIDTIVNDMTLPHEGTPIAFAGWGTLNGPGLDLGNNPPSDWGFGLPWGVIFVPREGNPAVNTRVEIRNLRFYVLSRTTNRWTLAGTSPGVDGSDYNEDFRQGNDVRPANVRNEAGGGVSAKPTWPYSYHFWCCGRMPIDRPNLGGIFVSYQVRLIVDNPSLRDDRASARFLAYGALDYWRDQTSQWAPGQPHNGEAGHGRMKYVTSNWQAINMTTVPAATLRANPPPIE